MLTPRAALFICTLLWLTPGLARAEWPADWPFLQPGIGWFFYREAPRPRPRPAPEEGAPKPEPPDWLAPLPPEEREPKAQSVAPPTSGPELEAWLAALPDTELEGLVKTAPAASLRDWLPILMDQALTNITRVTVRKYLLAHSETLRRSDRFGHVWQEILWTDPAFDRLGAMPMTSIAQDVWQEEQSTSHDRGLNALRESVSLLLAVEPNCRTCELAWKITKAWAEQYGFTLRPIAPSLTTLADGTAALPYPQIIDALEVTEYPTLYLVQPSTHFLTRLGTGILADSELATRLLRLAAGATAEGALNHATRLPTDLDPSLPAPLDEQPE